MDAHLRNPLVLLASAGALIVAALSSAWWSVGAMGFSARMGLRAAEVCVMGSCRAIPFRELPMLGRPSGAFVLTLTFFSLLGAAAFLVVAAAQSYRRGELWGGVVLRILGLVLVGLVVASATRFNFTDVSYAFFVALAGAVAPAVLVVASGESWLPSRRSVGAHDEGLAPRLGLPPHIAGGPASPKPRFALAEARFDHETLTVRPLSGEARTLRWDGLASAFVRALPADSPYGPIVVCDLVPRDEGDASVAPLRFLPTTRAPYTTLPGPPPLTTSDSLRLLVLVAAERCPGLALDAETDAFVRLRRAPAAFVAAAHFEEYDARYA